MIPAVFCVDLDNTLIYSYKHEIGPDKIKAETYQGREISFLTKRTCALLQELKKYVLIVPTTTRTIEQYARVALGIGTVSYALACNGGILLKDGKSDPAWYRRSLKMTAGSRDELIKAVRLLEKERNRIFEVRFIQELFVFTKCSFPEMAAARLKEALDMRLVDVLHNGEKVYVVPKNLSKGSALVRFREYVGAGKVLAAGDSEFDRSMVEQADLAAVPRDFYAAGEAPPDGVYGIPREAVSDGAYRMSGEAPQDGVYRMPGEAPPEGVYRMPGNRLFSEELLEFMLVLHPNRN